jgi:hypothetical protein
MADSTYGYGTNLKVVKAFLDEVVIVLKLRLALLIVIPTCI